MSNIHMAFVSNSSATAQMINTFAPAMGIKIDIYLEAMDKAYDITKKLLQSNIDIILACGSTGKYLKEKFPSNVITLSDSQISLLHALRSAKKFSDTVAYPIYGDIPNYIELLAQLVDIKIIPLCFHNTQELISCVHKFRNIGIDCIVGSNIVTTIAKSLGYNCVEILYSEFEIKNLISESLYIYYYIHKNKILYSFLDKLINVLSENCVLCLDNNNNTIIYNTTISDFLSKGLLTIPAIREIIEKENIYNRFNKLEEKVNIINIKNRKSFTYSFFPVCSDDSFFGTIAVINKNFSKSASHHSNFTHRYSFSDIVGESDVMKTLRRKAATYAQTDASIFINGETGTGKEMMAHAIHDASQRRSGPFVAINCASLSESLLESELFGYEEGAFTGAKKGGHEGIFEMANGGTVYLDEIGDISPSLQVRLLRVLEAKEILRVGGSRIIPVDVRIISSSWKMISREVAHGRFRSDLYFRLSVLALYIPPLRERLDDIPLLVENLLNSRGHNFCKLSNKFFSILNQYSWPGNIRELDTFLQRYLLLSSGNEDFNVFKEVFNEITYESSLMNDTSQVNDHLFTNSGQTLKDALDSFEIEIIKNSLLKHKYNKKETAKELGISLNTLWRKLASAEIN